MSTLRKTQSQDGLTQHQLDDVLVWPGQKKCRRMMLSRWHRTGLPKPDVLSRLDINSWFYGIFANIWAVLAATSCSWYLMLGAFRMSSIDFGWLFQACLLFSSMFGMMRPQSQLNNVLGMDWPKKTFSMLTLPYKSRCCAQSGIPKSTEPVHFCSQSSPSSGCWYIA